ncbi:MAG: BrnT family toxin [Parvibaculum sp.]|nr:BrnT family toxin [Parvibaculum sp.]
MRANDQAFRTFTHSFSGFEWDEDKRQINLKKHRIDFRSVLRIFDRPLCRRRSDKNGETRFLVVGVFDDAEVSVIYTEREEGICRIISARRARPEERRAYRSLLS